jgi:thiamine pyrophosphate-dependent acetolactate synthase large subunit-like protein
MTTAFVGAEKTKNLVHIVLDNQAYSSTGNQPFLSPSIDFPKIAEGFRYRNIITVETESELSRAARKALEKEGPTFIHVKINQKTFLKKEIPRVPDMYTCSEIKKRFMGNIKGV